MQDKRDATTSELGTLTSTFEKIVLQKIRLTQGCTSNTTYLHCHHMVKTEHIRIRIEPELKAEGEEILKALGMTTSDAVTLFWRQMVLQKGLPFDVKIPNAETIAAINEPRGQGKSYKNAREMFADIMAEED